MIDAAERFGALPFAGVRWILSSGAKWKAGSTVRLRRQFPASRFAEFYGSSELSFATVTKDNENAPEDSVGRAFANVTISIRDHLGRKLGPGRPAWYSSRVRFSSRNMHAGIPACCCVTETRYRSATSVFSMSAAFYGLSAAPAV